MFVTRTIYLRGNHLSNTPCLTYVFFAPHRTALHRTAPHRTAPHLIAPHRTARHRSAPHGTAPHGTARHGTAPLRSAPLRSTSLRTAPHRSAASSYRTNMSLDRSFMHTDTVDTHLLTDLSRSRFERCGRAVINGCYKPARNRRL